VKTLTLRAYLYLAAIVVVAVLLLSWCADRARLTAARREAPIAAATGKALDKVAEQTPVIRQEQEEKQREVDNIPGADDRLPDGFARDLERVRRGTSKRRDP
jgi:hypothetical protein